MGNLKDELKIKLEKTLHIYVFAQDSFLYTEYFHNPDTVEELELITKSAHKKSLSMMMHLMFRTLVIEISKLFSNSGNDKFQLQKLINSLSKSGHFRKIGVPEEHINNWNGLLKENERTIQSILTLRTKLYAHTDNSLTDFSTIDITFKDIKKLLDIAAQILKSLYSDIYDTDLFLRSPTFDRERFGILKLLAKAEKERVDAIYKKYRLR
ncbi:hypothetical protein FW774_07025 [Pedobacter sp. BS3]|uniref:AbiU2 domain-containing protein n=1 Tax=Pedobacter sp. BS3 TaxID=2567937 RepID=UPI0011F02A20|nr:hypothetical protein [Pedobacter sp. BS3]TZF84728.1 hypothetical protein FW774_07025 [Pedobacter sp. BS3]